MKAKIIEKIEEAFFNLHPEVKPYYNIINLIKDLPSSGSDFQASTKARPSGETNSSLQLPTHTVRTNRKPGPNLQTRVLDAITELGRFVRLNEILTKIKERDSKFSASISPALTQLRQIGVLKNFMPTGNRKLTYWGLTEWEWEGETKS